MNKINVLFLSLLVSFGFSAQGWGWGEFFQDGINAAKTGTKGAAEDIEKAGGRMPNEIVDDATEDIEEINNNVKNFTTRANRRVNAIFELSETLAGLGGSKKQYNSYIKVLDKLRADAKNEKRKDNLNFDQEDFKDLIEQEASAIKKQQQQQRKTNVQQNTYRGRNKQPVRQNVSQQHVQRAVVPTLVQNLKVNVDVFNRALNPAQNNVPQHLAKGKKPVAVMDIKTARERLVTAIDAFKDELEVQREKACEKSTFSQWVYGGSTVRNWVATGALALGALLFVDHARNSEFATKIADTTIAKTISGWYASFTGLFAEKKAA